MHWVTLDRPLFHEVADLGKRLSLEAEVWWRGTMITAMSFTEIRAFLHSDSLIQEPPSICQMSLRICTSLISLGHHQVSTTTHTKSKPFPRHRARASRFLLVPGFLEAL